MNNADRERLIERALDNQDGAYPRFRCEHSVLDAERDDYCAIYEQHGGRLITTLDADATAALRTMHPASARLMVLAIYRAFCDGEQRGARMQRDAA